MQENIVVHCGVRQGGVLSPYIFKMCIAGIIAKIPRTYFMGFTEVSYIAYADDILLINRCKLSLSAQVKVLKKISLIFD